MPVHRSRRVLGSSALHLKIRHDAPERLVALPVLLLAQQGGRNRRGRRWRERDRSLTLGRRRRDGRSGLRRRRRGERGHGRRRRGGRGRLLSPEIVEHAAGELLAGHVGVAAVPQHGILADNVGSGALAGQQTHRAGAALLVREIERRRVDLKPGAAQHAGVVGCQARGGLGGCSLVVRVAEAHGAGGAGDELKRASCARSAVQKARAVGALDLACAGEIALWQVVLLLEALVQRAELGGVRARARPAAGCHARNALEGAVHGGEAVVAGEVGVDRVDVDLPAHGAPDRLFLDASFGSHGGGFGFTNAEGGGEAGDAVLANDADEALVEDDVVARQIVAGFDVVELSLEIGAALVEGPEIRLAPGEELASQAGRAAVRGDLFAQLRHLPIDIGDAGAELSGLGGGHGGRGAARLVEVADAGDAERGHVGGKFPNIIWVRVVSTAAAGGVSLGRFKVNVTTRLRQTGWRHEALIRATLSEKLPYFRRLFAQRRVPIKQPVRVDAQLDLVHAAVRASEQLLRLIRLANKVKNHRISGREALGDVRQTETQLQLLDRLLWGQALVEQARGGTSCVGVVASNPRTEWRQVAPILLRHSLRLAEVGALPVGLVALAAAHLVQPEAAEREVLEHGRALGHVGQAIGRADEVFGLAARALDQALGGEVVRAAVIGADAGRGLGRQPLGRGGGGDGASQSAEDFRAAHAVTAPSPIRVEGNRPAPDLGAATLRSCRIRVAPPSARLPVFLDVAQLVAQPAASAAALGVAAHHHLVLRQQHLKLRHAWHGVGRLA